MIFRIRYNILGGHVHFRMWVGVNENALGYTGGTPIMRLEEFKMFRDTMERGADHNLVGNVIVEFRPDQSITA